MKSYVYHSATATAHALIEHLIAMMEREPEKTFYFAFSGGQGILTLFPSVTLLSLRSEERRVGKECRL